MGCPDTEYIIITYSKTLRNGKIPVVFNFSKSALLCEMERHPYSNDVLQYHSWVGFKESP